MLKIKLKSLAAEAKIIRREELRCRPWQAELWHHRIQVVRKVSRDTHVAYAIVRGKPIPERDNSRPLDWKAVNSMVLKYGSKELRDKLSMEMSRKAA